MDFMKRLGGALHKSNVNISIRETQSRMVPPSYAILEANTVYIFSRYPSQYSCKVIYDRVLLTVYVFRFTAR